MQKLSDSLLVDSSFYSFVHSELLCGLPLAPAAFWQLLESSLECFVDRNAALIARREELQLKIDAFHVLHRNSASAVDDDHNHYEAFLKSIGYIEPPVAPFTITTHQSGLDTEIDTVCGPQIVVPVTRARFALNAANSRWGSLYDVLYARTPSRVIPSVKMFTLRAQVRHGRDGLALLRIRPPSFATDFRFQRGPCSTCN
jgi:malate synthase